MSSNINTYEQEKCEAKLNHEKIKHIMTSYIPQKYVHQTKSKFFTKNLDYMFYKLVMMALPFKTVGMIVTDD